MNEPVFRVLDIVRGTTVDGPGFRTSVYLAGCRHHCPRCHNPQSWDPDGGTAMTLGEIMDIIMEEDFDVTLTGGDPLWNPETTATLAKSVREAGHNVWLYTGFTIEAILEDPRLSLPLPYLEAIVDGPFIEAMKNPDLPFRGSSNQRIIYLKEFL